MKKAIITFVGKDNVGIIARVCTYLAGRNINILDISQTITGGYFNMMMVVDFGANEDGLFDTVASDLSRIGDELALRIRCQKEEIFERMHRI